MNRFVRILVGLSVATVAVTAQELARIDFRNYIPGVLDAPVLDMDGITRLDGTRFWAQLYYGKSPNQSAFLPAGGSSPFRVGAGAGYWEPQQITLPDVVLGEPIWVAVRVWEAIQVFPFPEMGAWGWSLVLPLEATNSVMSLVGLESFNLPPESLQFRHQGEQIIVEWRHLGASAYQLEATDSLAGANSWSDVFTWSTMEGFGTTLSVTNAIIGPQRFYRLKRWR